MANNIEPRVKSLEEYQAMFYQWIDELRKEHVKSDERIAQNEKQIAQNEERIAQNEIQIQRLADIQAMTARILRSMNEKTDDHEGRLSAAGI